MLIMNYTNIIIYSRLRSIRVTHSEDVEKEKKMYAVPKFRNRASV
jgi:hypothetical protein